MNLDLLPTAELVSTVVGAEARVLPAVRGAVPAIAAAADLIAARLVDGGRLVLAGAGTSGRLAALEAAELPGTFGLADGLVVAVVAGETDAAEDDMDAGLRDLSFLASSDVLVAVAASGATPYTLAAASHARSLGALVVSVTCVAGSLLASMADVAIEVVVGPEVLRGSTRLGAGSAQKIALDALTTAAMVRFGRVHGDVMVDVVPANAKLRERSAGLVASIVGCTPSTARAALERCDWNARAAVLVLVGGLPPSDAAALAARHRTLRAAMAEL